MINGNGATIRELWKRYARKCVREIEIWDTQNPDKREQNPPRFKPKPTDEIKPI